MTAPYGYPPEPQFHQVQPPPRPATVTYAATALILSTVANVGSGLFMGFDLIASDTGEDGRTAALVIGSVAIVLGIGFSVLAVGVLRGSNVARITAMCGSGLVLCCGGLAAIVLLAGLRANGAQHATQIVATLFDFLNLFAAPTAIILLLTPSANHWFQYHRYLRELARQQTMTRPPY